jgi:hypothetical protein
MRTTVTFTIILIILLAVAGLGVISCPKGHKSIGGFGGGGVPQAQGRHVDFGSGWDQGITFPWSGGSWNSMLEDQSNANQINGSIVKFGYRLGPTQLQMGSLGILGVGDVTLCKYDDLSDRKSEQEIPCVDKSKYGSDSGYVMLEFSIPGPGYYVMRNAQNHLLLEKK